MDKSFLFPKDNTEFQKQNRDWLTAVAPWRDEGLIFCMTLVSQLQMESFSVPKLCVQSLLCFLKNTVFLYCSPSIRNICLNACFVVNILIITVYQMCHVLISCLLWHLKFRYLFKKRLL